MLSTKKKVSFKEKKKANKILTKKTRSQPRKKERKRDLDRKKRKILTSFIFFFCKFPPLLVIPHGRKYRTKVQIFCGWARFFLGEEGLNSVTPPPPR